MPDKNNPLTARSTNNDDNHTEKYNQSQPIFRISPPSPSSSKKIRVLSKCSPAIPQEEGDFLKNNDSSKVNFLKIEETKNTKNENEEINKKINNESQKIRDSSIPDISHLSELSKYINEFLKSTKIRSFKNPMLPLKQKRKNKIKNQTIKSPEIIESKIINDETDGEETDYKKNLRQRAPSLGVASSVPSFRKMVSSIESLDSVENKFSPDKKTDETIEPKKMFSNFFIDPHDRKKRNLMTSSDLLEPPKQVYYRGYDNSYNDERKKLNLPPSVFEKKYQRKYEQWSKKPIIHVLHALKEMKSQCTKRIKNKNKVSSRSIKNMTRTKEKLGLSQESLCFIENYPSITSFDDKSTTNTSVLLSIKKNKKTYNQRKKNSKIMSSKSIIKSSIKNNNSLSVNDSAVNFDNIPQINGMYQRKKSDKCLACLHKSVKNIISNKNNYRIEDNFDFFHTNRSVSVENFVNFQEDFEALSPKSSQNLTVDIEDQQTRESSEISQASVISKTKNLSPNNSLKNTFDQQMNNNLIERENLLPKSFESSFSLISDCSKSASDHDDSDQTTEDNNEVYDEIPNSKSKYIAPCHAPLNLKPSLEPLNALRQKKAKSIQSRTASLEKSPDFNSTEYHSDSNNMIDNKIMINNHENNTNNDITQRNIDKTRDDIRTFDGSVVLKKGIKKLKQLLESSENKDSSLVDLLELLSSALPEIIRASVAPIDYQFHEESILKNLIQEYFQRLSDERGTLTTDAIFPVKKGIILKSKIDTENKNTLQLTKSLLDILVESKYYMKSGGNSDQQCGMICKNIPKDSHYLRQLFSFKSYNLIAPILGLQQWHPKRWSVLKKAQNAQTKLKRMSQYDKHLFTTRETGYTEKFNFIVS